MNGLDATGMGFEINLYIQVWFMYIIHLILFLLSMLSVLCLFLRR